MSFLSAVLQEVEETSKKEFMEKSEKWEEVTPKVKDLHERITVCSCALRDNFINMYLNFEEGKTLEQLHYHIRKSKIDCDYKNLINSVKDLPKPTSTSDSSIQMKKLNQVYNLFLQLCTVSEGEKELDRAHSHFRRYEYLEAIQVVTDLKATLSKVDFDGDSQKALANFVDVVNAQFSTYCGELSVEWENIFSFKELESSLHLTYSFYIQQRDKDLVQKVLQTLYSVERLNTELSSFSDFFLSKVLGKVLSKNCEIFTDEHLSNVVFNIKIDQTDCSEPTFQSMFNNLTAIFEFLDSAFDAPLGKDDRIISVLAKSISAKFFKTLIKDCIEPNLPYNETTYVTYKGLVTELESFNKFLISIRFVGENDSPLIEYMTNVKEIMFTTKCNRLMLKSINLMKESLSKGESQVGTVDGNDTILDETVTQSENIVERPNFLAKCIVTENIKMIVSLINSQLNEAIQVRGIFLWKMIVCIDDIVKKYLKTVPTLYHINLRHSPKEIALFFNNCFYLAHALACLPGKPTLPADVAYSLNLVLLSSIMDLRILGLERLTTYLQAQKDVITDSIQHNEKIQWNEPVFSQFQKSVTKQLENLNHLKECWMHVLPSEMYLLSMAELVDSLCQSVIMKIIFGGDKVTDKLIYMLILCVENMTLEVKSLFKVKDDLEPKISNWSKLVLLPKLLKAQLLEITTLWNETKTLSPCYTCEEVRHIIKMRFPDDEYTSNVLSEIQ